LKERALKGTPARIRKTRLKKRSEKKKTGKGSSDLYAQRAPNGNVSRTNKDRSEKVFWGAASECGKVKKRGALQDLNFEQAYGKWALGPRF